MKKKIRIIYLLSIMFLLINCISLTGCSSGRTVSETKEEKKEEPAVKKTIRNIELEERNLIEKTGVKSVDRLSFDLEDGKPVNRQRLATITYNKKGFPVETVNYDGQGKVESIYKYKYDRNGSRTETIRSSPAGLEEKRFTYIYNEYGNKIKSERYDMQGNLEKYYEYKYDEEGNLIEDLWYDKSGKLEYRIEYDYDSSGKKSAARTYNEKNRLLHKYEFLYDGQGNLVEEVKFDPSGDKTGTIQYVYQYF
jgi:hypothetical protein